jgi:hypothetical protein
MRPSRWRLRVATAATVATAAIAAIASAALAIVASVAILAMAAFAVSCDSPGGCDVDGLIIVVIAGRINATIATS